MYICNLIFYIYIFIYIFIYIYIYIYIYRLSIFYTGSSPLGIHYIVLMSVSFWSS